VSDYSSDAPDLTAGVLAAYWEWHDNRKRAKELRRAQVRIGELLLGTTGDVPVASRGFIATGTPADDAHLLEESFARAGHYLLNAYQLIYVVTSEIPVTAAGHAGYSHRRDVGVDELQAEIIDLRQIRSYRCFPADHVPPVDGIPGLLHHLGEHGAGEHNCAGYIHLTPVDGTTIRVVLRPDVMNPPPAAKNKVERMMCDIAGGFGAEDEEEDE
jgi:hypothetical protein